LAVRTALAAVDARRDANIVTGKTSLVRLVVATRAAIFLAGEAGRRASSVTKKDHSGLALAASVRGRVVLLVRVANGDTFLLNGIVLLSFGAVLLYNLDDLERDKYERHENRDEGQ
jgi:hypothetical protein